MLGKKKAEQPQVETDNDGLIISVPIPASVVEGVKVAYAHCPSVSLAPGMLVTGGEDRPQTHEQHEVAQDAFHRGLRVQRDEKGASICLPAPENAHPDEELFKVDDTLLIEMVGVRRALAAPETDRYERAGLLAAHGRLTRREVEHLSWLAATENPHESLPEGTVALTQEQAAEIMQAFGEHEQHGRPGGGTGPLAGWQWPPQET